MNMKKLQGDFLIADAKNKQDNAKLLTTMRKEGMVTPAELKSIKDTAATKVFGEGGYNIIIDEDGTETIASKKIFLLLKNKELNMIH